MRYVCVLKSEDKASGCAAFVFEGVLMTLSLVTVRYNTL